MRIWYIAQIFLQKCAFIGVTIFAFDTMRMHVAVYSLIEWLRLTFAIAVYLHFSLLVVGVIFEYQALSFLLVQAKWTSGVL